MTWKASAFHTSCLFRNIKSEHASPCQEWIITKDLTKPPQRRTGSKKTWALWNRSTKPLGENEPRWEYMRFAGWRPCIFLPQHFPVLLILSLIKKPATCDSLILWYIGTHSPRAVFLSRGWFCLLGDIRQSLETIWVVTTRGLVQLASGVQRPRMWLRILQFGGPATHKKNYLVQYINRATIEKPALREEA